MKQAIINPRNVANRKSTLNFQVFDADGPLVA